MVRSMTGFARKEATAPWGTAIWELRSVNSRYLDANLRLPEDLRGLEPQIRERVAAALSRGKVDCTLRYEPASGGEATYALDMQLAAQLLRAAREIGTLVEDAAPLQVFDVLRWPGVFRTNPPDLDTVGTAVLELLTAALAELLENRAREGRTIAAGLLERCAAVAEAAARIRARLPALLENARERLAARVAELTEQLDAARLEQEVALLAQKLDVAEELDRLDAHVEEVRRVLGTDAPVGRRLDFLMQEMNREANTLGAKSGDVETSRAAVDLKVLIEQMREQVQNLE